MCTCALTYSAATPIFKMEAKNEEDELLKKPLIRPGFTIGRVINLAIMMDYVLVLVTAFVVSGSLGVLNSKLYKNYQDASLNNRTCILYSSCTDNPSGRCHIQYNSSGGCEFIEAGFVIIGIFAFIYVIVCIFRTIFATDIWLSVIADILVNVGMVIGVLIFGITISVGLAFTCSEVNKHYTGHTSLNNCSAMKIPNEKGYMFYEEVTTAQNSAWFCFLFLVLAMVVFIVRSCILCRRKSLVRSMDDTEILTAEDDFKAEEDDSPNPV